MKPQLGPFLLVVAVLSGPLAWPQVGSGDSSQSGSADSSQQQASNGPQPAFTHPENRAPLAMLDEITAHSYINFGLGASVAYDTDAAAFSYQHFPQTLFIISPSVQVRQTHPTFMWYLGAYGGFTSSNAPGYYSTSSPSAQAGFVYQISRHWQLAGNDQYMYTADPFTQYLVLSSPPTYNQPNPTTYLPLTTTETNYGNIDLTYQIDAHNSLTFTGTESFRRFLHDSYTAYNLYTWGGVVDYEHVFSARLSAGAAYSFTSLDFGHGQSRSGIQMIEFFATYRLSPHMSLTGWVGPEYTATKNEIPILCTPSGCFIEVAHFNSWDTAFGANFGWSGVRTAATAGFYRSISDGGILLGIVQLYQVNANFTRQLTPRWTFLASMLYGNNTGHSTRFAFQHLNSFTGTAGFSRQLNPNLSATLQYVRFYETQKNLIGFAGAAPKWTDNRFQFTLQYNWGHSLGR